MAESERPLEGPDLTRGVPLADLGDGAMLAGHAHGKPVILVRRGDDIFAVGGTCTHYGAPLRDGLLTGDTIRCPWHHACFNLRTGEAAAAPALDPLARWDVERRGARVFVTGEQSAMDGASAPAGARRVSASESAHMVIVGAGAAGHAASETLRREGHLGAITLIGADDDGPYDRPNLSKDFLAGSADPSWIPLRSEAFLASHGVRLVTGTPVKEIEVAARHVLLENGDRLPYDRLLIATGAEPVRLQLSGGDLSHVHYLRSLGDSRAIIARAERARRAVVLGASFIGLEVAASLRARGIEVHVAAPEAQPLERILGPQLGAFVRSLHEEHGVVFHLGTVAASIDTDLVTLENGERLPADLVVVGVGVRPATSLAERAGLTVQKGVLVDEYLETSAPGIFAAGDIARWPDPRAGERIRVEHWVVAQRQGQTAARNMLADLAGRPREAFRAVPFFWSAHYDTSIRYVGHAAQWDEIVIDGELGRRDAAVSFRKDGRVLAVATVGRDRLSLEAELALERADWSKLDAMSGSGRANGTAPGAAAGGR